MRVRNPVSISSVADLPTELTEENAEGVPRDRVTKDGLLQKISEEWHALTPAERHALTADKVKQLEERRENRVQAVHNSNISTCHDARVTLKNIKTEVSNTNVVANMVVTHQRDSHASSRTCTSAQARRPYW